ncbi:MAG: hypothetical protein ACRECC_03155 [Pseudolabrys sp.]
MCSACELAFWQICDVLNLTPEQIRIAMETGQFPATPNPPAQFACDAPADAQPASDEPKP